MGRGFLLETAGLFRMALGHPLVCSHESDERSDDQHDSGLDDESVDPSDADPLHWVDQRHKVRDQIAHRDCRAHEADPPH